ncbi:PaaI family thioesterase [Cupriavidus sp. 2MCAB6]|uniref:PaaI family thioesterase n=1 Tax=Cupriavidus sp. 2MCAB6 TaxID=3232981 RepID=UPI003F90C901
MHPAAPHLVAAPVLPRPAGSAGRCAPPWRESARPASRRANARGFAHGGLITALADNAMGLSCGMQFAEPRSLVTVNLSIDFLSVARIGQWLLFETSFTKVGGTLCFAQAFVTADGVACARANATFRAM